METVSDNDNQINSLSAQNPVNNQQVLPSKKVRKLAAVVSSVFFGALYSIDGNVSIVIFAIFAMGCGSDCSKNPFPMYVMLGVLIVLAILTTLHFFLLKLLLPYKKRFLLLWILGSWILGFALSPLVSFVLQGIAQKKSETIVNQIYAPFQDAQKFHPRVTLVNYSAQKDPAGTITAVHVTITVSADHEGELEITGGFYDQIQEKNIMNSPVVSDSKSTKVNKTPTEVSFQILPDKMQKLDIFGVYMIYKPDARNYSPNAELLYNGVDDVSDSGKSSAETLPDFDNRTVFYKIILQ